MATKKGWVTEQEKMYIVESATINNVSAKNITRIKRALNTNGVTIIQKGINGGYIGILTASGVELTWRDSSENKKRTV